jgi:hypothetical protein
MERVVTSFAEAYITPASRNVCVVPMREDCDFSSCPVGVGVVSRDPSYTA